MTPVGEIKTQTVILAAGSWSSLLDDDEGNRVARFKIKPVRGQMAAIENLTPPLRHVVYSRRAYLVPRHSGFVIAGSTSEKAGYDKSVTAGGLASILARAIEIAPGLQQQPLLETWAGLRPKGPDNLPLLGRDPRLDGLVYATAHYRNGILLTPITAKAICELIVTGESSIDLTTFSVARFSRRASLAEEDNLEG
jgi:glycine oxidase